MPRMHVEELEPRQLLSGTPVSSGPPAPQPAADEHLLAGQHAPGSYREFEVIALRVEGGTYLERELVVLVVLPPQNPTTPLAGQAPESPVTPTAAPRHLPQSEPQDGVTAVSDSPVPVVAASDAQVSAITGTTADQQKIVAESEPESTTRPTARASGEKSDPTASSTASLDPVSLILAYEGLTIAARVGSSPRGEATAGLSGRTTPSPVSRLEAVTGVRPEAQAFLAIASPIEPRPGNSADAPRPDFSPEALPLPSPGLPEVPPLQEEEARIDPAPLQVVPGVLGGLTAVEVAAAERGMRQFLEQLEQTGQLLTRPPSDPHLLLWMIAGAAALTACEVGRRQIGRLPAAPVLGSVTDAAPTPPRGR